MVVRDDKFEVLVTQDRYKVNNIHTWLNILVFTTNNLWFLVVMPQTFYCAMFTAAELKTFVMLMLM